MTPQSDRDIVAIRRQLEADGDVGAAFNAVLVYVGQLLDRLAALEHERDEALELTHALRTSRGDARHNRDVWQQRAEHADAALLSLQTAVRAISEDLTLEGYDIQRALKAVLLSSTNDNEEKDLARAHGEAQASTDRISRVQQTGEE